MQWAFQLVELNPNKWVVEKKMCYLKICLSNELAVLLCALWIFVADLHHINVIKFIIKGASLAMVSQCCSWRETSGRVWKEKKIQEVSRQLLGSNWHMVVSNMGKGPQWHHWGRLSRAQTHIFFFLLQFLGNWQSWNVKHIGNNAGRGNYVCQKSF